MGKIVYLMGKSSTGKDTIFKKIIGKKRLGLKTIVPYTTRPIRAGEQEGVEYYFVDEDGYQALKDSGKIVEERAYNTFHGVWRYFTVDDGRIDLDKESYIMIGTLEAYLQMRRYFGQEKMVPILIELDDGERLQRALKRERSQENPKYKELCRRFLADSDDFAEEKIAEAGAIKRVYNDASSRCTKEIVEYISQNV